MALQEHRHKLVYREGSGKVSESAHMVPSAVMKHLEEYSRLRALTALLPPNVHRAFDDHWKEWARQKVASGVYEATVGDFHKVLSNAAQSVPELRGRTADTMHWLFEHELYQTLGLTPDTKLPIPYSSR